MASVHTLHGLEISFEKFGLVDLNDNDNKETIEEYYYIYKIAKSEYEDFFLPEFYKSGLYPKFVLYNDIESENIKTIFNHNFNNRFDYPHIYRLIIIDL
jgi:hypothetical protein